MDIDEGLWELMQDRLGYSDEEMKTFRENPKFEDVMSNWEYLSGKTIVVEVIESHGCNALHKVGDKFYFDGSGNLITKLSPKRICPHAIAMISPGIMTVLEMVYAGVDPNEMRFNRTGCPDIGVQCGGWGRIIMEMRVEERERQRSDVG